MTSTEDHCAFASFFSKTAMFSFVIANSRGVKRPHDSGKLVTLSVVSGGGVINHSLGIAFSWRCFLSPARSDHEGITTRCEEQRLYSVNFDTSLKYIRYRLGTFPVRAYMRRKRSAANFGIIQIQGDASTLRDPKVNPYVEKQCRSSAPAHKF